MAKNASHKQKREKEARDELSLFEMVPVTVYWPRWVKNTIDHALDRKLIDEKSQSAASTAALISFYDLKKPKRPQL